MNNIDFKNSLLTKEITKLVNDAIKPMSIIEIKEKFNLNFPFKVKRIKFSYEGNPAFMGVTIITSIEKTETGFKTNNHILEALSDGKYHKSNQCAIVQDYILYEEN